MARFSTEHQKMDPEHLHRYLPRLQSKYPIEVLSEKLLNYLKDVLQHASLEYQDPLTPLYKGYERLLYSFHLSSCTKPFSKPLILRLYQEDISEDFVQYESSLQQAMLTLDFPVPEIIHICKDQFVLGGYFFLMEHLQGKNLNDYITQHYHTIANIPRILAQTQLRLHQLDTDFVMNLLKEQGIDIKSYTFEGILETLKTKTYALSSDHLEAKFDWLNTNQPETFEKTVICHSDLHFGNILYDDNGVTGVLDWGKTRFCEREYDIAATLLLLEMIHRHYTFSPQFIIRTLRGYLIWMYLSEYRNHQRIDTEKIQYYKALIAYQEMMTIHASSKRDAWYQQTLEFYLDQFETSTQFF